MGWFSDATGIKTPSALRAFDDANRAIMTGGASMADNRGRPTGYESILGGGPGMKTQKQLSIGQARQGAYGLVFNPDGTVREGQYAGLSDPSQRALEQMQQPGGQFLGMAQPYYEQLLQGQQNPYLDATFNKSADAIRQRLDSQFAAAGRYGAGEHQNVMSDAYSDLATQLYGGAYESDQGRRMQALGMAPEMDTAAYQNLLRQYTAGVTGQQAEQAQNDFQYQDQMQKINDYLATLQAGNAARTPVTPKVNPAIQSLGLLAQLGGTAAKFMNPATAAL